MANIPLKTIKFPGLDDTYTVPQVDNTLSVTGAAADAKKTGDEISKLNERLNAEGLSENAKSAFLDCFAHVAWVDEHGQDYYDALYAALYGGSPTPSFDYGIYEPDAVVTGKYIDENGDVQTGTAGTSFYIEDYIPVIRSNYWIGMNPSSLRIPNPGTAPQNESNWRISEYDEAKRFIKQTQFSPTHDLCASTLHAFDSNTKYMRLGWSDSNSSTNAKKFDIENPDIISILPVEVGNIDANTGANAESTTRIRTAGYIPASNTITIEGCPFYDSWSDWVSLWVSAGYSYASFFYVVRCYDSSKNFLGSLMYNDNASIATDISNVQLPTGTAYVRMLFQTENHAALSIGLVNHLIIINGTKYYMEGMT